MSQNLIFDRRIFFNLILILSLIACEKKSKKETLFYAVPSSHTHIDFSNTLEETDQFNIIQYLYFYNGGGVAIGDVNNDELPDIYFTSNQSSNKLYLNKGNFQFEDITSKAGVAGTGNWKTGVTMADVNGDGFLDLFVCGVGNYKNFDGRNQLLINNGDLTFTDRTEEYGLSFQGLSSQASFFDYDNDGDLDMYLLNHSVHTIRSYGDVSLRLQSDPLAGDKLYRNDLVPTGVNHFSEVTSRAGILSSHVGYGLGIGISDLNLDGYLDIYVSNDFHESDYLYINQGNGTFNQTAEISLPHSSRFSMGNDIADINNDGWSDILTLDMMPKDEGIIKTTAGEDPYDIFQFKLRFGFNTQFARNTLQLNRGVDSHQQLLFSDIAPLAGVEATDWSWAPLLADFDNDGFKDIFIANGIVRRPNDLDYINFIAGDSAQLHLTDRQLLERMPEGKVSNVFFHNQKNLLFTDSTMQWIGNGTSLSNGTAYADLDNDGDLDLVVNNINEKAFVYRNDIQKDAAKFLSIKLVGVGKNTFGIGTKVIAYTEQGKIFQEQIPTRGWLSSVDYRVHIGLGNTNKIDSLTVIWPNGKFQTLKTVEPNQKVEARQSNAIMDWDYSSRSGDKLKFYFSEGKDIAFHHRENDFNVFNKEKLIPQMASTEGPRISVGDVNNDHLDDFFIGGAAGQQGAVFIQHHSGDFIQSNQPTFLLDSLCEDVASAFFDADGNGHLDLIVVSGGSEFNGNNTNLLPRLYLNDGKGNFKKTTKSLPNIFANASCVKPADFDSDGDIDLFIGGRIVAGEYGLDPPSFILTNNGSGIFTDATSQFIPEGLRGMITDATWLDINQDARLDLLVVGEWMPITILIQNDVGVFQDKTEAYGLKSTNGWWNTVSVNDFDKDGDIDFVVGNLGLNSRLKASRNEPVSIFIGDVDNNGSNDPILTYYNQGKQYPLVSRDQLVKQIPALKRKFLKYADYKDVLLEDIIPLELQKKCIQKNAFIFSSVYIENLGNGKLSLSNLPIEAQVFPIFSFCIDDINGDNFSDIIAVGNLHAIQPDFGRYDAGYGVIMLGDGKGKFTTDELQSSLFKVRGEGRDIKTITNSYGEKVFLVSRNNNTPKTFWLKNN